MDRMLESEDTAVADRDWEFRSRQDHRTQPNDGAAPFFLANNQIF
jgi:hypothetical protein